MSDLLRIGIMGCANIARRSVIPMIRLLSNNYKLISVASRTEDKALEFANEFNCKPVVGYQNLLESEDIDIIYMPLPTGMHEEWVMKALEKGKHVLVEKSLALNLSSAEKMVKKAKDKQLLLMENFMFLYHSQHSFVKGLIQDKEIGEIRSFRSSFGFPPLNAANFRYNKMLGGGALLDAAAYTTRVSTLFLGKNLQAQGAVLNTPLDKNVDIFGGAFLKNEQGVFSEVAFGFDNFYQCEYEIWGSKGKIIAKKAFTPGPTEKPKIILEKQDYKQEFLLKPDNHFKNILLDLYDCIASKQFEDKYSEILEQSRLLQQIREQA